MKFIIAEGTFYRRITNYNYYLRDTASTHVHFFIQLTSYASKIAFHCYKEITFDVKSTQWNFIEVHSISKEGVSFYKNKN